MLLSREFIAYLSRQLVKRMTPQIVETTDPAAATEMIAHVIEEELQVEDRLNDEVRELLAQYSDYMRREGVSYQEMFRRIKNTLISQRKVIRAAGRDTGDNMKLSRDKINDISHKLVTSLRKAREFRLKKDPNDVPGNNDLSAKEGTSGSALNSSCRPACRWPREQDGWSRHCHDQPRSNSTRSPGGQ